MAFKIAASMAFKEGYAKSKSSIYLEPIMKVEVTVPEEYMGDVIGDINSRRGRMEGMEASKWSTSYKSICSTYQKCLDMLLTLRSKTQGRGNIFNGILITYEEVP